MEILDQTRADRQTLSPVIRPAIIAEKKNPTKQQGESSRRGTLQEAMKKNHEIAMTKSWKKEEEESHSLLVSF